MDLYVITRNIQLFKWGGRGDFRGLLFFIAFTFEVGLFCQGSHGCQPPPHTVVACSILSHSIGWQRHPPPGAPISRGTQIAMVPSCTPWVFLQGKPQRWLWECHQHVAFRTEDMAGKGNVGLTSLPSGRGPRVGVFPAILPFHILFFSDWSLFTH